MQDTESAAGGGLFIGYGSVDDSDAATRQIGREIVDALQRHGLKPDWDGRSDTRIYVPMKWKRRRALDVNF